MGFFVFFLLPLPTKMRPTCLRVCVCVCMTLQHPFNTGGCIIEVEPFFSLSIISYSSLGAVPPTERGKKRAMGTVVLRVRARLLPSSFIVAPQWSWLKIKGQRMLFRPIQLINRRQFSTIRQRGKIPLKVQPTPV